MKQLPKIGEQCYLRRFTGSYYVDLVKRPVTVIAISENEITVQHAKLLAPIYHCVGNPYLDRPDLEGQRVFFYDTVAESIEPDENGKIEKLTWHPKKELWGQNDKDANYPAYLIVGEGYKHQPYLD
jgi:hypothetical protein